MIWYLIGLIVFVCYLLFVALLLIVGLTLKIKCDTRTIRILKHFLSPPVQEAITPEPEDEPLFKASPEKPLLFVSKRPWIVH